MWLVMSRLGFEDVEFSSNEGLLALVAGRFDRGHPDLSRQFEELRP